MWMVYRIPLYSMRITLDPNQTLSNRKPPAHERGVPAIKPSLPLLDRGGVLVEVFVRDNNVDRALKVLKKKLQREGVFREMKLRSQGNPGEGGCYPPRA